MKTWNDIKKEAEVAYKASQFSVASQKYEEAFEILLIFIYFTNLLEKVVKRVKNLFLLIIF